MPRLDAPIDNFHCDRYQNLNIMSMHYVGSILVYVPMKSVALFFKLQDSIDYYRSCNNRGYI